MNQRSNADWREGRSRYLPAAMAYRSNHIRPADGVEVLRDTTISPGARWRSAVLDLAVLPYVAATRRSRPAVLGAPVALEYGFRRWDWRTERGLELALARREVRAVAPADILEIGNVLAPAGLLAGHTIIDKYETGVGVTNVDILDVAPTRRHRLAVSISTLEHVGWDEDPRDATKAVTALHHIADLASGLFVTIPVGYHPQLEDEFVRFGFDEVVLARRTTRAATWQRRPLIERREIRFGSPYLCANGILIGRRTPATAA